MTLAQRHTALLKINQLALTCATTSELLPGFFCVLKDLVPYERAGFSLYDPDHDSLKIAGLYGPRQDSVFTVGHLLSRKNSQSGWVFENKETLFRRDLQNDLRFAADRQVIDGGYNSMCSVPLVVRDSCLGVMTILAAPKRRLSVSHAAIFEEISNQVALAISALLPRCPIHANTRLVCPKCIGACGGKSTVAKHRDALSTWGKKGGRGRKKSDFS